MKLSRGIIASSLCCAAAASRKGHVFVYDPVPATAAPQQPAEVSPETARLILAQRLGLSRYHSLKDADEHVIDQLNAYGGSHQFFGGSNAPDRTSAHVLVWIEGVDDVEAIIKNQAVYSADFTISDPPPAADNDRLIRDLIQQAETLPPPSDPLGNTYRIGIDTEAAFQDIKKADTYNDFLTVFRADKSNEAAFVEISKALDAVLQKASSAQGKGSSVTVVLTPSSSSHSKRDSRPYGEYQLAPSVEGRRQKTEAFLAPSSSQSPVATLVDDYPDLEDMPTIQQADDNSTVLGILPVYFGSLEKCQQQTRNCSGHGECKLLHKGDKGQDARRKDRYGCACKATVVHVGEDKGMESKRKTTYWGGPACQKKDVSQPFWLFVASGVILAFLISAGIGMLYSMGAEELPSVIGAGVSGPTRK